MKKTAINRLFLYRHRFVIGYTLLAIIFFVFIFTLPLISPGGLSEAERQSVITSYNLHFSSITTGDLVDLPYHIVQKICILLFGMDMYTIKLPSIAMGIMTGFMIILLLNRWFRNNVALLASIITVLCIPFLYIAGSGTPDIMFLFWPVILLWLGSKIQGERAPDPRYCLLFALVLVASIFTPHMIYMDIIIVLYAFLTPHLRHTIKQLPKLPFILTATIVIVALGVLITNIISSPSIALELLFSKNSDSITYLTNLRTAFEPLFSWGSTIEGVFLTPMISLPVLFISFLGLLSTVQGIRASRNSIALIFLLYIFVMAGFNPSVIVLIVLPLSIFIAHGLKYIIEKWYNLFPDNPYARIFAIFPIMIFISIIIFSGVSAYIFGYRYTPAIATNFDDDLDLVFAYLDKDTTLILPEDSSQHGFYEVYEDRTHAIDIATSTATVSTEKIAVLGGTEMDISDKYSLSRIITSSKSDNSGRIYIYSKKN